MKGDRFCSDSLFFLDSCNDFFLVVVVPPMEHNFRNKARVASLGWSLCHGCDD